MFAFTASLSSPTSLQPPGVLVRVRNVGAACSYDQPVAPLFSILHSKNRRRRRRHKQTVSHHQRSNQSKHHLLRRRCQHKHKLCLSPQGPHPAHLQVHRPCRSLRNNSHSSRLACPSTTRNPRNLHRVRLVPGHHPQRRHSCPRKFSNRVRPRFQARYQIW